MIEERHNIKMPQYKNKFNYNNTYTKYEYSTQVLDFTKKPHRSSQPESAKARQSLLSFKLLNRSMHKSAAEHLDLEEYIASIDLKNRTKYAAISQVDQRDLNKETTFVYNSDHNDELSQGDKLKIDEQESSFNYVIDSNALGNVDSSIKHTSAKVGGIDYNNNNLNQGNYNELDHASKSQPKVADQNERIDNVNPEYISKLEAKKPGFLVAEQLKSQEKDSFTPEHVFNQQTQIKQQNYKLESNNLNKVEYVYFDKSESDEEKENLDKSKVIQSDKSEKVDYVQVPMYEMEKTVDKDKSKFRHNFDYYLTIYVSCSSHQYTKVVERN